MSVIQVYALNNEATDEDKDSFYEQLQATLDKVPMHDLVLVIGDLNAKVVIQMKVVKIVWGSMELGQ